MYPPAVVLPLTLTLACRAQRAGIIGAGHRARGHRKYLGEIAGVERNRGDRLLVHQCAGGWPRGAQLARAFHRDRGIASLESGFEDRHFGGIHRQLPKASGVKTLVRHFEPVRSRRQQREAEGSRGIGSGGVKLIRGGVLKRDGDPRNGCARGVRDQALQRAGGGGLGIDGRDKNGIQNERVNAPAKRHE